LSLALRPIILPAVCTICYARCSDKELRHGGGEVRNLAPCSLYQLSQLLMNWCVRHH